MVSGTSSSTPFLPSNSNHPPISFCASRTCLLPEKTMSETFSVESGKIQTGKLEDAFYWSEFFSENQDLRGFKYLPEDSGYEVEEGEDYELRNVVEDDGERDWYVQEDYEVNQRIETNPDGDDNFEEDDDEEDEEDDEEEEEEEEDDEGDEEDSDEGVEENPFFQVTVKSNSNYLSIPLRFCRKYIWKEGGPRNIDIKVETHGTNHIIWTIDLEPYRRSDNDEHVQGARLTSGWQGFVEDNELTSNDMCVFKLIRNDEHETRFVVFAYRWDDQFHTFNRML